MSEVLNDVQTVSAPSVSSRKRSRQESDCDTDPDLDSQRNYGGGSGSSVSRRGHDEDRATNGHPGGSQKRARTDSHEEEEIRPAPSWAVGRSPGPVVDSRATSPLSTPRSPGITHIDTFIPLPVSGPSASGDSEPRTSNERLVQTAEQDLARSMEFDEHLDALRRSPVPPNTANMPIDEDILDIQAVEEAAMLAGDSDDPFVSTPSASTESTNGGSDLASTRRLRFTAMSSILSSRTGPATERTDTTNPSRLPPEFTTHVFGRPASPSTSESSGIATRVRLGLARSPDQVARSRQVRDQLLQFRSGSGSPVPFVDSSERAQSPSANSSMTTGYRRGTSTESAISSTSSSSFLQPLSERAIPERADAIRFRQSARAASGSARPHARNPSQTFFEEMREIFEPFEPFSFDAHQNRENGSRSEASLTSIATEAGSPGNEGLSFQRRPRQVPREQDISDFRETSFSRNASSSVTHTHNNTGSSPSTRHAGDEDIRHILDLMNEEESNIPSTPRRRNGDIPLSFANAFEDDDDDWLIPRRAPSTNTQHELNGTEREIRRLVDEIRQRSPVVQPIEARTTGLGQAQAYQRYLTAHGRPPPSRPPSYLRDDNPPRSPLTHPESFDTLAAQPYPSLRRPNSRSLLDPTFSIGSTSSSSGGSRAPWSTSSGWETETQRVVPIPSSRRPPRPPGMLWNSDDDESDLEYLADGWNEQETDRPRPLSSLFTPLGGDNPQSRRRPTSIGEPAGPDEPLWTRFLPNRVRESREYRLPPPSRFGGLPPRRPSAPTPESERQSPSSSGLFIPSRPPPPRPDSPPPTIPEFRFGGLPRLHEVLRTRELLDDSASETSLRSSVNNNDGPPRPIEPRLSPVEIGPDNNNGPNPRPRETSFFSPLRSASDQAEARASSSPADLSRSPSGSSRIANIYRRLHGSENDALPPLAGVPGMDHLRRNTPVPPSPPDNDDRSGRRSIIERSIRRTFLRGRDSGETFSELIRRRAARAEALARANAEPPAVPRSPSPPHYRLPRPGLLRETETASRRNEDRDTRPLMEQDFHLSDTFEDFARRVRSRERASQEVDNPDRNPAQGRSLGVRFAGVSTDADTDQDRRSDRDRFSPSEFATRPGNPAMGYSANALPGGDDGRSRELRDRQQIRDAITRHTRDDEGGNRRAMLSRFERPRPTDPLSDEPARTLQRRLRESEAEVTRALHALDQWGELDGSIGRDADPTQSRIHRFGETLRRRRVPSFSFGGNEGQSLSGGGSSTNPRQARRSPSPPSLAARQLNRQARFARAQGRYRELGGELPGEVGSRNPPRTRGFSDLSVLRHLDFAASRHGRHREVEEHLRPRRGVRHGDDFFQFPAFHGSRSVGDYMRDEDFDPSYENLIRIAALIGDAKPRGTPAHLLAALPTGFYKDFVAPDCETRCPICLDDYKDLDPVLKISDCDHWFHKECLEQWLKNARSCPLCKTTVRGRKRDERRAHPPPDDAPGPSRRPGDDDDSDDGGGGGGGGGPRSGRDAPILSFDRVGSFPSRPW